MFPGTELARCQRATKKNCCVDQKLAPVVFGQTLVPSGCKPDAVGSSSWGALADSLDMKCLLLGMSGKDHTSLDRRESRSMLVLGDSL